MPEEVKKEEKKTGKLAGNMLRRVKMFLGDAVLLASPLKDEKTAGSKEKFTVLQTEVNGLLKDNQGVDLASKRKELAHLYKLALPEILKDEQSDLEAKCLSISQQMLEATQKSLPFDPKFEVEFKTFQEQLKKVKQELVMAKVRARFIKGVSQTEEAKALNEVKAPEAITAVEQPKVEAAKTEFVADQGIQLEIPVQQVEKVKPDKKKTARQKGTRVAKLLAALVLSLSKSKADVVSGKTISALVKEETKVEVTPVAEEPKMEDPYKNEPLYEVARLAKQKRVAENMENKEEINKRYLEKLEMNKQAEAKSVDTDMHVADQEEVRNDYGYNTQLRHKDDIIARQVEEIRFQNNHIQAQEDLISKQAELIESQKVMLRMLAQTKNFGEFSENEEISPELTKKR